MTHSLLSEIRNPLLPLNHFDSVPIPEILVDGNAASFIAAGAVGAIGVSGGKDSCALAFTVNEYLDRIGHAGPRVLIHSDLGRVEWRDSLPTCRRLADAVGLELIVVRRQAGDMMDRWLVRWRNNVARYANLECVKLILPWSTPAMRFCTSELKKMVLFGELAKRFPGKTILSASGIRREESARRAQAKVFRDEPSFVRKGKIGQETLIYDWHPLLDWSKPDVFCYLEKKEFRLHEAYTRYGSSRVSCAFCILASRHDLIAAASCADNHEIYREMVELEIESTFSFHGDLWLGDVAPQLLDGSQKVRLAESKERARARGEAEKQIPKHLLYQKGWPQAIPTWDEAELLCRVRRQVGEMVGIPVNFTEPDTLVGRYRELMEMNRKKEAQPKRKTKPARTFVLPPPKAESAQPSLF